MKCKVCGSELTLTKESHYVARTEDETGLVKVLSNCESTLYDAFDCPTCGCQNLVGERHRPYEWNGTLPTEIYEDEEETHGVEIIDLMENDGDSTSVKLTELEPDKEFYVSNSGTSGHEDHAKISKQSNPNRYAEGCNNT